MRISILLALLSLSLPGALAKTAGEPNFFLLTDQAGFSVVFPEARGTVSESEVLEFESPDPKTPDPVKIPGRSMLTSVTLARGLTEDTSLDDWRKSLIDSPAGAAARDLLLIALDSMFMEITRWELRSAWPSRLTVAAASGEAREEIMVVFDELPLDGPAPPALPVIVIRLPAEGQTIEEPPVRIVADVSSPESQVATLRIHGGDDLLREVSAPGSRQEVEWEVGSAGAQNIVVTAVDNLNRTVIAERAFTYAPSPSIEYASWQQGWFLPEEERGATDDADHDGASNLAEFAFRSHPLRAGAGTGPSLELADGSFAWAGFSYVRRQGGQGSAVDFGRPDLRYLVEETSDLAGGWSPSPVPDGVTRSATVVPNPDGFTETVTIYLHGEPAEETLFMRLRLILQ